MKIIITEKQLETIKEQIDFGVDPSDFDSGKTRKDRASTKYDVQPYVSPEQMAKNKRDAKTEDSFVNPRHDQTSTLTRILQGLLSLPERIIEYLISFAQSKLGLTSKNIKIRLIFPQQGWEFKTLTILKSLGIVTGIFNSIESAIKNIKVLKNKKLKASEIVIGSHGDGKRIIMTQRGDEWEYQSKLIENLKDIVSPNSIVFFTACYGANYLKTLVRTASKLGVGVYSSSGVYNYVSNRADEGFYYCAAKHPFIDPKNRLEKRDEVYWGHFIRKISPGNVNIEVHNLTEKSKIELIFDPKAFTRMGFSHKFNVPTVFNVPDEYILNEEEDYHNFEAKQIYVHDFTLYWVDFIEGNWIFETLKSYLDDGSFKKVKNIIKPDGSNFFDVFRTLFGENLIRVLVDGVDIKKFEDIQGYRYYEIESYSNKELLKLGVCKKVPNAPIKWDYIS